MKFLLYLCVTVLSLTRLCVAETVVAAEKSPTKSAPTNIVLLYADNLGYGDLGCYGNFGIQTPRIDQLARDGAKCTDFYVVASTCTVSRGAILTGRHPQRNGLLQQLVTDENWYGVGLPHRERIIPQYLNTAGYVSGCFGKWNIGFAPGSRPTERGFDEFLGCRSGNIHYFAHTYHGEYDIFRGVERCEVKGYSTEIFADATCDFLRRQSAAKRPFFAYLPFNAPHYVSTVNTAKGEKPQWQVPEKYLQRYGWSGNEPDEKRRYFAVVTAMDDAVGKVLDTLKQLGLQENTLVIFISDMGAILRPTHGFGAASNAPFRDGAPSMYEGGIRVPAIFRWPGKIKPQTVTDEVLTHLDVLPLCLRAADGQARDGRVLDGRVLDGRDPFPVLAEGAKSPHQYIVAKLRGSAALRAGRWKIVRTSPQSPWELYDLVANGIESNNLAQSRPQELARLVALYESWEKDVQRDASQPVVYSPKGSDPQRSKL